MNILPWKWTARHDSPTGIMNNPGKMNSLLAKATKQLASIRVDLAAFKDLPIDQNDAGKQGTL
jgi:hypothetical protein